MKLWKRTNSRSQLAFICSFTCTGRDIIHKQWWVGYFLHSSTIFSATYRRDAVRRLLCFSKSLFLEPSRISNSITVRGKIVVKISMLSVVFQSNVTVCGQTDLWIIYYRPECLGGSDGLDLSSYLSPSWSTQTLLPLLNSSFSIVDLILTHSLKLIWSDRLKNLIPYMCWTNGTISVVTISS